MTGQASGSLLTNEFLLLQTTSTALPGLLKVHGRISHPLFIPRSAISMTAELLLQLPSAVAEAVSVQLF